MFLHIFTNRCKCLVRDKVLMFWTLMFPIVLASLFGLAFSNLSSEDKFSEINIAVVDNNEYQSNQAFQSALSAVTDAGQSSGEKGLFNVILSTHEQADELLKNNKIEGYILFDGGANLVIKESGINQTIIKTFLDDYAQIGSAITNIVRQNPTAFPSLMEDVMADKNYLKEVSPSNAEPNTTLNYYYALVAMACLFGSFWGVKEISAVQADLSPQGARVNLAPAHKLKIFGYSLCAAAVVHLFTIFILIAYLSLFLKVDFGRDLLYVLLACVVGSMMGVSMGALIGALIKKDEIVKIAVLVSVSMILSFLAGLMMVDMKYIVTHAIPVMAYINPANLITDAFYSLYYFDTYNRFFTNIGLLLGFTVVFYLIVYFVLRRQRYASL
ncbi:MAG: ABC transporter permease [Firmicutes bacterium HGW-Firmicutes-15]|nr:MAG: ABC transporter permease [Firmicutes bacterium HGW-Firmicutes-15]